MFKPDDRVGVAVSGGKDSVALLHGLCKAFPEADFVALHVDLGIEGYSQHCKVKVEELARNLNVDLFVFDLKEELGFSISDYARSRRGKVCSHCGVIKRHVFEELAERADVKVLATGHNLDDYVALMLNNFFAGNWIQLARLKVVLKPILPRQTVKVKPLIKTPEDENLLYCIYADIPFRDVNCPYAHTSRLRRNREILDFLTKYNPNFKYQALKRFLELIEILDASIKQPELRTCKVCGFPSSGEICAYCRRIEIMVRHDPS